MSESATWGWSWGPQHTRQAGSESSYFYDSYLQRMDVLSTTSLQTPQTSTQRPRSASHEYSLLEGLGLHFVVVVVVPDQGLNPHTPAVEDEVLTTGSPGKSLDLQIEKGKAMTLTNAPIQRPRCTQEAR